MQPIPIVVSDLTVENLGKTYNVHHGDGYLLGRLVEIRHRFAEDGTPETRVKLKIFEGDQEVIVKLTLGPDMRLQK
jgi:hypothetical protein